MMESAFHINAVLPAAALGHPWLALPLFVATCLLFRFTYRIFFHPLARIPGPMLAKCTSLWLHYHTYVGTECTAIRRLHEQFGPVVRVAPNEVDISDGDAIAPVYGAKSDLVKSACYTKFTLDGHTTVFATLTSPQRAMRLKAMMPLFSPTGVRESKHVIDECVAEFVHRLSAEASTEQPVDVLNLAEAFATDVTTACLFGSQHKYGALSETVAPFSASGYLDDFLAVGRFFYMPNSVWVLLEWVTAVVFPDKQRLRSVQTVDRYCDGLVKTALETKSGAISTFQGRLLSHGLPQSATAIECKDSIFAGGYFIGVIIAQIFWLLARNPDKYTALRKEVLEANSSDNHVNTQSLPYLQSVVKEGLRVVMPSPARLPRIVSDQGLTVQGHFLPPGTNVGLGALQLHLNPDVFPDPEKFLPERWETATPEMRRDWVPFGMGVRSCIGRGLSNAVISEVMRAVAEADVLGGAVAIQDRIDVKQWTISKLKEGSIMMVWPRHSKAKQSVAQLH
ncbi:cytochrome P450 4A10 [Podospora aff. communis PSN243]|uniref:Cytochrome P450 4A10 n=1 Tax=Podospora aff. communis PSN243 TaxID=3040156 RepID=A0AAV9G658_9PEZI|nr:cytochrome P450 4A10 [Podospora aff. communis PSN243]